MGKSIDPRLLCGTRPHVQPEATGTTNRIFTFTWPCGYAKTERIATWLSHFLNDGYKGGYRAAYGCPRCRRDIIKADKRNTATSN